MWEGVFTTSVSRVWRERIKKYRLIGGYCVKCGKRFYPVRSFCPKCGSNKIKEIILPRKGRVISYTIIRTPPAEFKMYAPYIVAIVELEDGTRILAQLTDIPINEVKIGMQVEAVFRRYREQGEEGIIEYGIKFRPVL